MTIVLVATFDVNSVIVVTTVAIPKGTSQSGTVEKKARFSPSHNRSPLACIPALLYT